MPRPSPLPSRASSQTSDQVGPAIAWLKGIGLRFDFLTMQFLTKSQPRLLPVGGGMALVEALAARPEALGIAIHYEATAERLKQDEDGRVTSLCPQQAGGATPPRRPGGGAGLRRLRQQCRDAGPLHRPACRLPAADLQGDEFQLL
jgi:hypothetical protein